MTVLNEQEANGKKDSTKNSIKQIKNIIKFKYYSRVVWAMCVIGNKQQLAKIYPIFEDFFLNSSENNTSALH